MLTINTMRYGTDEFTFHHQSLLTTTKPWDTSGQTEITGFTVGGSQPTNTNRRVIFKVDNAYYYFAGGTVTAFPYSATIEDVLAYGNTVDEISAISSVPEWIGKKIYPVIGLYAAMEATTMPTIKLALNCRSNTATYTKTEESAIYTLREEDDDATGASPKIIEVIANTTCTGAATCTVTARYRTDGEWSDYKNPSELAGIEADAVQFKMVYTVTEVEGADSAKVDSIVVRYKTGGVESTVAGNTAEIYSQLVNYEIDLANCYAVLRHKRLIDAEIKAYVTFRRKPKTREQIQLGIANGEANQEFTLGVNGVADTGISPSSIQLFADALPLADFGYNVLAGVCQVTADNGKTITASYEYNWDEEVWHEMTPQLTEPYSSDDTYMTRFAYTLPEDSTEDMQQSCVKFVLNRPEGKVENQSLGTATGQTQIFVLEHFAKKETIEVNGQWSYDDDTKILKVIGTRDTELRVSYEWIAEGQTVYYFAAGWVPAI